MKGNRKAPAAKAPTLKEETLLWEQGLPQAKLTQGSVFVFGVDEAGRGCLAGPVCAAVTCWEPLPKGSRRPVPVRDSKVMKEEEREACFEPVREKALTFGVGFASCNEIDRWNIWRANHLAVARALEGALQKLALSGRIEAGSLSKHAWAFLSDGNQPLVSHARFFVHSPEYMSGFPLLQELLRFQLNEKCVVKGDSKVFSIAAASVLAKVSRDRHMVALHEAFPAYEFASHKGYSTPRHVRILREKGPCSEHRRSFAPVSDTLELFPLE
jgi:ribonuclease HII